MKRVAEAAMGVILIVFGMSIGVAIKHGAEAYSMGIDGQCRDQLIAAAEVELHGLQCPGAADYGHSEASIALCALSGGKTPEQVARQPICKGVLPIR